jgi:superfamily II DNA or RNA helicase
VTHFTLRPPGPGVKHIPCTKPDVPELWPHQVAALRALDGAVAEGRKSGLIVLPTGTGKTYVSLTFLREQGKRALFVAHRQELIDQTVKAARRLGFKRVGVVKAARDEWHEHYELVVASVPSLHETRIARIPRDRFGNLVVDEAHHVPALSYLRVLEYFRTSFVLGLTATPRRHDGVGLHTVFGNEPLYTYPLRKAVEDGMLASPRQFGIRTEVDLDRVRTSGGDFSEKDLERAINTEERNEAIVDGYLKHGEGRRSVCFVTRVAHARALCRCFNDAGVRAAVVCGEDKDHQRERLIADFKAGKYRVMVNVGVLTEGYDDPGVSCLIMARPTKSRSLYTQMVGRGLRLHPGKTDCLVLDVTDNCRRHKLVTIASLLGKPDVKVPGNCQGRDVLEVVTEAEEEVEEVKPLPVTWKLERVSPWPPDEDPTLDGYSEDFDWQAAAPTQVQVDFLKRRGYEVHETLSKGMASHLIDQLKGLEETYRDTLPPTPKQTSYLKWKGLYFDGVTKDFAHRLIAWDKEGRDPSRDPRKAKAPPASARKAAQDERDEWLRKPCVMDDD